MPETKGNSHLVPQTKWQALYLVWFVICFLMVWIGTWAVNEPIPVLGMPLVFVWCSGWGLAWLAGCLWLGLNIEKQRNESRGE
jgi:hypothetical protein